ncbi:hypothetical protein ACWDTP_22330 [Mycobacterium sp. NPDC003449]
MTDDVLLGEFTSFMATAGDRHASDTAANAATFVAWYRANTARGLDAVGEDDIVDFVYDWSGCGGIRPRALRLFSMPSAGIIRIAR